MKASNFSKFSILHSWRDYVALMRVEKPVGFGLCLWPVLMALWFAAEGTPPLVLCLVFTLGVIFMRACGCVVNDIWDRDIDGKVKRTNQRPLVTGRVSVFQALVLAFILLMLSVSLLFWLNPLARLLAPVAAILAVLYPLAKRVTSWPQVVLGVAFNWGILMAFAAVTGTIPWVAWLFYAGSIAWTLAYDTFYAMVDRDDDLHLNIKSSAMSAGSWDLALIAAGEIIFLSVLLFLGYYYELSAYYYTGIILVFLMMTAQLIYARSRSRERCFKSFRQQQWLGALLWLIVVLAFYLN